MVIKKLFVISLMFMTLLLPCSVRAYVIGHHGGMILDCTAPVFFDEQPASDGRISNFKKFSFTASENTDPESIKVWLNNKPQNVKITPQRSGRFSVEGNVEESPFDGRQWIKVTGMSVDGCDQIHNWFFHSSH